MNSCLVNRFQGEQSKISEHSDDEPTIYPKSKIYTVSIGCTRTVIFRNTDTGEVINHTAKPGSLYTMTRRSQNYYEHKIDPEPKIDPEQTKSVRYSFTFRSTSWRNNKSTILFGDSNSAMLNFGTDRGSFGMSLPGNKVFAPTIDDIDPLLAVGYSNVVILCGINNIRSKHITEREDIKDIYDNFKLKIKEIQSVCKGINVVICPILPSRLYDLNKKAVYFNSFIFNDLVPNNFGISYVWGINEFLDNLGVLKEGLAKPNDYLHINKRGAGLLGRLIKQHFFPNSNIRAKNVFDKSTPYNRVVTGVYAGGAGQMPAPPT